MADNKLKVFLADRAASLAQQLDGTAEAEDLLALVEKLDTEWEFGRETVVDPNSGQKRARITARRRPQNKAPEH